MDEDVYYVCYLDDEGDERVSRFPYYSRKSAEQQVEWLTEKGYRDAHVRVAGPPTGEVMNEEIPNSARKVH